MPDSRDLSQWLLDNERKAILPFKWALLFVTMIFYSWKSRWMLPSIPCFAVFNAYFLTLAGVSYLLLMRRVTVREAQAFCLGSFFLDIAFITALIYCDIRRIHALGLREMSDFYYFYFLLVMRGYSLSTSRRLNLAINLLIVLCFVASFSLAEDSFEFLLGGAFQFRLALLWLVIMMSWYIVDLINAQKDQLLATSERLMETRRLADLGEMAAVMAHEVNTPIGIISANAELALRQAGPDACAGEELRAIRDASQRCKRIVSALLSYAQPPSNLPAQPVNLGDACREVIGLAFPADGAPPRIHIDEQRDLPPALADPGALRQALMNVFLSARSAARGTDGLIETRIERLQEDARAPMARIIVNDNGPPMAPGEIERAFEPLFTRTHGGDRLGLAVARRLIESQGGRITAATRGDGRGSRVEVCLPLAPQIPQSGV